MQKPIAGLPAILAITDVRDGGPCDGGATATCPHCGADGRYVFYFVCVDGSRRGAMSGCLKLFPQSASPTARLVSEAFKREREAAVNHSKLASWWAEMIEAARALGRGEGSVLDFTARVQQAERSRQAWLNRNGYGRYGRGRRA